MMLRKIFIAIIFLFSLLFQLQCKSIQNPASQLEEYKSIYIEQFKLTYFLQILAKSYNNSKEVQAIINSDHSGFTEPVLTDADYLLIDSLTTIDNEKMKIDSAAGYQRAEGSQGKRPLGFILARLNGKWLDSLAKQRSKLARIPETWILR